MTMDLRCGDYRETLADVTCDALITDTPYRAGPRDAREGAEPNRDQRRDRTLRTVRCTQARQTGEALLKRPCIYAPCTRPGVRKVTETLWKCAVCYAADMAAPWGACEREISPTVSKLRR